MKKHDYQQPTVILTVEVRSERAFLNASLVDEATVIAVGQEVEEHDFSSPEFNHQWE